MLSSHFHNNVKKTKSVQFYISIENDVNGSLWSMWGYSAHEITHKAKSFTHTPSLTTHNTGVWSHLILINQSSNGAPASSSLELGFVKSIKMRSLNSIGLGLSLTFGFLLVALMGEIYYLLWWKRRSWNRGVNGDDCCSSTTTSTSSAREFMYMFCCKKMSTQSLTNNSTTTVSLTVSNRFHQQQNETQNSMNRSNNKDMLLQKSDGQQRLLFTIKEETKEDLESEDGTSVRSLSDLMLVQNSTTFIDNETPYLTPLSSPSMFTPPHTPLNSAYTTHIGFKFNPLFESSSDAELSRLKSSSSPPPKFKFLQEAEDKFQRRKMQEEAEQYLNESESTHENRFKGDESFITIIVAKGNSGDRSGQLV